METTTKITPCVVCGEDRNRCTLFHCMARASNHQKALPGFEDAVSGPKPGNVVILLQELRQAELEYKLCFLSPEAKAGLRALLS